MRILHTSDWHLGRQFHGQSLETDHAEILEQVFEAVRVNDPDVLIIAGDIYDRPSPPATAVRLFNTFVQKIYSESRTAIVLIAGNHDSGDRIASNAALADRNRVLIRGPLSAHEPPLIIDDEHGPVVFSALPFGNEFSARECFGDTKISNPADVLAAQISAARTHVPDNVRWVISAHAFVTNAHPSESERRLAVGGVETVPASAFDGAHYVALGHLHSPQNAGSDHIRYSGSPLAFGFDEAENEKSMTLVELASDGSLSTEQLPFNPLRAVRTLKGSLAELVAKAAESPSDDFIEIVLTDKGALIDPMGRIRENYPHALKLTYERDEQGAQMKATGSTQASLDDPMEVIHDFFAHVSGEGASTEELKIISESLTELTAQEEYS